MSCPETPLPARAPTGRCAAWLAGIVLAWSAPTAGAQSTGAPAAPTTTTQTVSASARAAEPSSGVESGLDARLFYQLIVGEIGLRTGDPAVAYQMLLDAAQRTQNEALFRRVTEIALQARAPDQALAAIAAWRSALPESLDAMRFQMQLLIALNRPAEAVASIGDFLRATPLPQRPAVIGGLPRLLARAADQKAAAEALAQALAPYLDEPGTRTAAQVALGRVWLAARDPVKALDLAERASQADAGADTPALLALELPASAAAEAIVVRHLAAMPSDMGVRLVYARMLTAAQRYGEATTQLEQITRAQPKFPAPWLTLGALHLELHRPADATNALEQYVKLMQGGDAVTPPGMAGASDDDDDDEAPSSPSQALTQAWLMLAQAAEQQRDYAAAERWLARIDNPQRALDVQLRRASILAHQGKMDEARAMIRRSPEQGPADARAKLVAEAQLLREHKLWAEAANVLERASSKEPNDVELLYEQAMVAEKLDHLDAMERLLRKVIELKPDHHHAYNALGYSLADRKVRLPEARSLILKALELSPGEPFITDSLGWVEFRLGHRDEALRLLRGAYAARPDPEIAAHLGEVLWLSGEPDEARRVFREGQKRDASNEVLKETLTRLRVQP